MALRDLDPAYLGVVVDDRDPQAVFDAMLTAAETSLPEWEPRNGALETVLMEAAAVGIADLIYAANRVLGSLVEAVVNLYSVTRYEGIAASGTVKLTFTGTTTASIPEGTEFRLEAADTLLVSTALAAGTGTTLNVPVVAADPGGYLNAVPAATPVDPVTPIPGLASAELLAALSGGADPESDVEFLQRASARFARVTSSLVVPSEFTAFALEQPTVKRAAVADMYDVTAGSGVPGDHPGYLAMYVYGPGSALAADDLTSLASEVQARSAAILTTTVEDATPVSFNVTASVTKATGYDTDELKAAIADALAQVWSWQYSGFGADVDPLDVQAVIADVPGVDSVSSLTAPASTVSVAFDEFAVLGTVTITVV